METKSIFQKIESINMLYRILILVGVLILLGGVFFFLVYTPKTKKINQAKKEIATLTQKINDAKRKTRDLAEIEAAGAKAEADFKLALNSLPKKREIPSLLRNISQLGVESNLDFRQFTPKKEKSENFFVEIPVLIEIIGRYHDVALFFDKVGKMKRIVNIQDVSMRPDKTLSTTLKTKCTAVTFRFKEDNSEGKKRKRNKKK